MSPRTRIILLVLGIVGIVVGYILILNYYLSQSPLPDANGINEQTSALSVTGGSVSGVSILLDDIKGSGSVGGSGVTLRQTGYVSVSMPGRMMTSELQQLFERLATSRQIVVSVSTFFDMDEYRSFLMQRFGTGGSGVDIALVPTIWWDSIAPSTYTLQMPESLTPYMHPLWQPFTDDVTHTLIPRGLDPLVTYIRPEITIQQDPLMVSDLVSAVMIAPSLRTDSMTRLWGMSPSDAALLANNRPRETMWSWMSYLLIQQLIADNQTDLINQMIDLSKLSVAGSRNTTAALKRALTLSAKQPGCKMEALLCLMRFGYGGILIAPLSDMERQERLFAGVGTPLRDMQLWPRPRSGAPESSQQPVIGRGWTINKDSPHLTGSLAVLNSLISQSIRGTGELYQHLIPASTSRYPSVLSNPLYYRLQSNQSSRRMIRGSRDTPSTWAVQEKLVERWK